MKFGAIIIGDEILSGKRQDKHLAKAIATLGTRGLEISWAQYLGDDPELIATTLRRTFSGDDVVFSFGGIGATPDDHTRQSAAQAAGVALKLHPGAEAEIRGRFRDDPKGVTPQRLMMGEFPEGAAIIPNPYNRIPGFTFRSHHFLPGFPEMAWPMLDWLLDTYYPLQSSRTYERSVRVAGVVESQLLTLMEQLSARHSEAKLFSLPRLGETNSIEIGFRGERESVESAFDELLNAVSARGLTIQSAA